MISFKSNPDNQEYMILDKYNDIGILMFANDVPVEVKLEASEIMKKIKEYHKSEYSGCLNKIVIRKDSYVGTYLISNSDQKKIINEDLLITYIKVINAFNVSAFEGNEMSDKILVLFREQASGSKEALMKKYDEDVLDYILKHDSFYGLARTEEKTSPKEYLVYEDGKCMKRTLSTGNKVLKKTKEYKIV